MTSVIKQFCTSGYVNGDIQCYKKSAFDNMYFL